MNPMFDITHKTLPNIGGYSITNGRVIDIVMDPEHPKFNEVGGWNGINTVIFTSLQNSDESIQDGIDFSFARPIFPNIKYTPLKNEIIFLISLPNKLEDGSTSTNYYFPNINIWNHPHHNALPLQLDNGDYVDIKQGPIRQVKDQSTEINLGDYFIEKTGLKPLKNFEGDFILEGRFGNSIRFGSTNPTGLNFWSNGTQEGDPITIISNGDDNNEEEGWVPRLENINNSTIILSENQEISFKTYNNFKSFFINSNTVINPIVQPSNIIVPNEIPASENDIKPDKTQPLIFPQERQPQEVEPLKSEKETFFSPSWDEYKTIPVDEISEDDIDSPEPQSVTEDDRKHNDKYKIYFGNKIQYSTQFNSRGEKWWCFIATCRMLLSYYGISITNEEIRDKFTTGKLLNSSMLFSKYGLNLAKSDSFNGGSLGRERIIHTLEKENKPFIVEIQGTTKSHFVVVIGLTNDDEIIIHDPALGSNIKLRIARLKLRGNTIRIVK